MKSTSPSPCPAREVLDQFRQGLLPDPELERLADHIAACRDCSDRIAESSANDDVLAIVKRSLLETPLPEEEACARIAARLRAWPELESKPVTRRASIPQRLGRLEVLELISQGGTGDIFKARDERDGRLVALKALTRDRSRDASAVRRFRREADAGKAVPDHAHLIRGTEAGEADGVHFLVMEFVPGSDLARVLAGNGPLAVADACELVRQAALGAAHLHAHGVVHRDLKPSNLLLSAEGNVKVLDLGLALLPGGSAGDVRGHAWTLMGTADYVAPEQIVVAANAGPGADVYSLGCTLFKLLTGRAPFEDDKHNDYRDKLRSHSLQTPPELTSLRPDVPPKLAALVARILAKRPAERGNALHLAEALA
jgi:serine/threonine protein kinase